GNQCRTFILCDSNIFLGPFACDFADQRTIVNCGIRWIANLEMGEHRLHRRNKLWADTVMHDMARGERTALPTMCCETHNPSCSRFLDIRIRSDDECRFAAQFHDDTFQCGCCLRLYHRTDFVRAREMDKVNTGVCCQHLTCFHIASHDAEHPFG